MDEVKIVAWVLAVFAVLASLSKFFTFVAAKTKNATDDKLANVFAKVLDGLAKVIDAVTANDKPTPSNIAKESEKSEAGK